RVILAVELGGLRVDESFGLQAGVTREDDRRRPVVVGGVATSVGAPPPDRPRVAPRRQGKWTGAVFREANWKGCYGTIHTPCLSSAGAVTGPASSGRAGDDDRAGAIIAGMRSNRAASPVGSQQGCGVSPRRCRPRRLRRRPRPPLTVARILARADGPHARAGSLPAAHSGAVPGHRHR